MNRRVVIIDDDEDDIYFFQNALRSQYPPIELRWYVSAPAFLDAHSLVPKPPLSLLDNNLPGQTGVEWLQTFLAHPYCQAVPVVIYTGSESSQLRQSAIQAGAAGYLLKPSPKEETHQLVDRIVYTWLAA